MVVAKKSIGWDRVDRTYGVKHRPMAKVGPHVILQNESSIGWAASAPTVKMFDDSTVLFKLFDWAQDSAVRIYRHWFTSQPLDADPHWVAQEILRALGDYRHPKLFVEVYNEIPNSRLAEYLPLLRDVTSILHQNDVMVAGPSCKTGDYNLGDWEKFQTIGLDAVAVHAYWGNQGFTKWHALRFSSYWQDGDLPVLITECGRDAVEGGKGGWRKDGILEAQYRLELLSYDQALQYYPYVIGAAVFTSGPTYNRRDYGTDNLGLRKILYGAGMAIPLQGHG